MGKKAIVVLLVGLTLASVHLADAQQPRKVAGLVGSSPFRVSPRRAFRRQLRELGYVEGKNIAFEYRYAEISSIDSPH